MGFLWYRYAGGWISLGQSSLAVTTRNGGHPLGSPPAAPRHGKGGNWQL